MMKISPPAFPTYLAENMAHGMSLRDYFAALALPSIINDWYKDGLKVGDNGGANGVALIAYIVADAMLAERDK